MPKKDNDDFNTVPFDAKVDGKPISVLISQAVKLKTAQAATLRTMFESYPVFYQNSIYPREEVTIARGRSFEGRMDDAIRFKRNGNSAYQELRFADSIRYYEMAIAVFKFLENTNIKWKTEGIMDKDVIQVVFQSDNETDMKRVHCLLLMCYCNIALVSIKAKVYGVAIDACNESLSIDSKNIKALYLRSRARVLPKSSGALEQKRAIIDLESAIQIDPRNATVLKELGILRSRRRIYLERDKKTFGCIFERGELYGDKSFNESKTVKSNLCRSLHRSDGVLTAGKKHNRIDFHNPSLKLLHEAAAHGIDLKDPSVLHIIDGLHKNYSPPSDEEDKTYRFGKKWQFPLTAQYYLSACCLFIVVGLRHFADL